MRFPSVWLSHLESSKSKLSTRTVYRKLSSNHHCSDVINPSYDLHKRRMHSEVNKVK